QIHAGKTAADSSESVNALAYTVGNDIYFGEGQYQPGTTEGQELLAHELTHVVQQNRASGGSIGDSISIAHDIGGVAPKTIQRQEDEEESGIFDSIVESLEPAQTVHEAGEVGEMLGKAGEVSESFGGAAGELAEATNLGPVGEIASLYSD